jgi:hypothetical protein
MRKTSRRGFIESCGGPLSIFTVATGHDREPFKLWITKRCERLAVLDAEDREQEIRRNIVQKRRTGRSVDRPTRNVLAQLRVQRCEKRISEALFAMIFDIETVELRRNSSKVGQWIPGVRVFVTGIGMMIVCMRDG